MPAACTLQQHRAHRPGFVMPASRTTKTLRPAELTQILPTGLLASETRLELGQIPGIIFHRPRSYILGSPESSKYPSRIILGLENAVRACSNVSPRESARRSDELVRTSHDHSVSAWYRGAESVGPHFLTRFGQAVAKLFDSGWDLSCPKPARSVRSSRRVLRELCSHESPISKLCWLSWLPMLKRPELVRGDDFKACRGARKLYKEAAGCTNFS